MKRPADVALIAERFDSVHAMQISPSALPGEADDRPALRLSSYEKPPAPPIAKSSAFLFLKCNPEQFTDLLWLFAALVIIAIIHRYVPNHGAPPHSIVDVVKSTTFFPR